jgi:hypothetical protein
MNRTKEDKGPLLNFALLSFPVSPTFRCVLVFTPDQSRVSKFVAFVGNCEAFEWSHLQRLSIIIPVLDSLSIIDSAVSFFNLTLPDVIFCCAAGVLRGQKGNSS